MMDESIIERARILAEATGRDFDDVLADLADDGILNQSNQKKDADLISQLKEAAELISTVQEINREVASNTVLNGGKNKTAVAVETTLEGDIVDRAIASAHRKVVELKKIALIIAPIFLIISGGTLEGLGVINVFDSDEKECVGWECEEGNEPLYEMWGCTAWDAENYNPDATHDDGSCYWEQQCYPELEHDDSWAEYLEGDNDSLVLHIKIKNWNPDCAAEVEVMVSAYHNNTYQWSWEYGEVGTHWVYDIADITLESSSLRDLPSGFWSFETRFKPINQGEDCCYYTEEYEIK